MICINPNNPKTGYNKLTKFENPIFATGIAVTHIIAHIIFYFLEF